MLKIMPLRLDCEKLLADGLFSRPPFQHLANVDEESLIFRSGLLASVGGSRMSFYSRDAKVEVHESGCL